MKKNEEDIKSWQLKCRFTPAEQETILAFCEKHHFNVSALTRVAIYKYMKDYESNSKSN